jgi:anti-anti-sigma factor
MLKLHIERIGDVAVIQCAGRIVQSDATFKLRDTVRQQRDARIILLDLSDVESLGGSGLGMLLLLERWTSERGIQFKIIGPPDRVRQSLERARSTVAVETAGMVEVLSLLGWYDHGMTSEVGTTMG